MPKWVWRSCLCICQRFVPDQIMGLKGYGEGKLSLKGALSQLDVEGEVYLDSAYLVSVPYGITMRLPTIRSVS